MDQLLLFFTSEKLPSLKFDLVFDDMGDEENGWNRC